MTIEANYNTSRMDWKKKEVQVLLPHFFFSPKSAVLFMRGVVRIDIEEGSVAV